jgi:hypothetical protein
VSRTPGIARSPRPTATGRSAEREPEPAVEEDHRDAERQEDLNADGVERELELADRVGPQQRAGPDQHEHPWNPQDPRHELGDEPGREQEGDDLDDVAGRHVADSPPSR